MTRKDKFTPIPPDGDIEKYLTVVAYENHEEMISFLEDLRRTMAQTQEAGEPAIFAYGKLQNYLSNELKKPEMVKLLCAAIWELA